MTILRVIECDSLRCDKMLRVHDDQDAVVELKRFGWVVDPQRDDFHYCYYCAQKMPELQQSQRPAL